MRDVDVSKKSECRHVRRTYRARATHGHPGAVRQRLETAAEDRNRVLALGRSWFGEKRWRSREVRDKVRYQRHALYSSADERAEVRVFLHEVGRPRVNTGIRRFRRRVRTCHQGEDQSQDERAKVGGCERQALGREDVFEVGDGTLQHAESAGDERNPISLAFIGLLVSSPDLPDHEEDLVRLRVRVCQHGEEGKNCEKRHLRFRAKTPPVSQGGRIAVSQRTRALRETSPNARRISWA